jgi:hypothetical protein
MILGRPVKKMNWEKVYNTSREIWDRLNLRIALVILFEKGVSL